MDTRRLVVGAVALAFACVACGGDGTPRGTGSPTASPTPSARPSSTGHLAILRPTTGEVFQSSTVEVKLRLTGARLVKQTSTTITPDTGHVHLSVDGKIVSLLAGLDYPLTNLAKGIHLLSAELVAADHGFFNPRVITTVTFRVA